MDKHLLLCVGQVGNDDTIGVVRGTTGGKTNFSC